MFRSPALICFSGPKEVFVPGSTAGTTVCFSPPVVAEADVTESVVS
jgi:hypothetical protein